MALSNAYSQYKESSILTSCPEELTLQLYNGLVRFIMQAEKSIEEKDVQKAHNSIIRAQDIIQEFIATLDFKYELSHNLLALYDYINNKLIDANIKKDSKALGEALTIAKELRDTWIQALKLVRQQEAKPELMAK